MRDHSLGRLHRDFWQYLELHIRQTIRALFFRGVDMQRMGIPRRISVFAAAVPADMTWHTLQTEPSIGKQDNIHFIDADHAGAHARCDR